MYKVNNKEIKYFKKGIIKPFFLRVVCSFSEISFPNRFIIVIEYQYKNDNYFLIVLK